MFTVNALLVTALVSVAIPFVVGVVTKSSLHPTVKAIVTMFFSSVTALIVAHITDTGVSVISAEDALLALGSFLVATLSYLGLYKPVAANAKLAPKFGIGPRSK